MKNMPFTIGISGDSGSGKSALTVMIEELLGKENILLIEGDGDHKWERGDRRWDYFTHLNPKANFLYRQAENIAALRAGESVMRTEYDHATGKFTEPKRVDPKPYILLCGLHALYLPQTRESLDLKIYMDIDEPLRRYWKIQRDTVERGHTREEISRSIETRMPDAKKYIYPQKKWADIQITYFDKNVEKDIPDDYVVELGVKITVGRGVNLEPLMQMAGAYGVQAQLGCDERTDTQSIVFTGKHLETIKLPTAALIGQAVPQADEILLEPPRDTDALHTILEIVLLTLISRKLLEREEC